MGWNRRQHAVENIWLLGRPIGQDLSHRADCFYRVALSGTASVVNVGSRREGELMTSTEKAKQESLLKDAMKQPGVSALMDAYSTIDAVYTQAAEATSVVPVVITSTSSASTAR